MNLFLNDIAGSEIIVILIFILMFFGSKSIPGIAQSLGKTIRQIKDASNEVQNEIKNSGVDIKKDLNLQNLIDDTAREVRRPLDQYSTELNDSIKFEPPVQNQIVNPKTSTENIPNPNDSESSDMPKES